MASVSSVLPAITADPLQVETAPAMQAEHICLESDEITVSDDPRHDRVGPSFSYECRIRGCATEFAVLEGHRLGVRSRRHRQVEQSYIVDLRFVDGEPVAERRVAWRCWQASAGLAALAALDYLITSIFASSGWQQLGYQIAVALLTAAICTGLFALYRTRETLSFHSVHGRECLMQIAGGLGCSRSARGFVAELARHSAMARSASAQSPAHFLRDEMREHHRLWRAGVLSDAAYEASKRRILQAHG